MISRKPYIGLIFLLWLFLRTDASASSKGKNKHVSFEASSSTSIPHPPSEHEASSANSSAKDPLARFYPPFSHGCAYSSGHPFLTAEVTPLAYPVWSFPDVSNINALDFETWSVFNDFLDLVRHHYADLLRKMSFNNLGYFVQFYQDYQSSKKHQNGSINFHNFFENYQAMFRPTEDSAGLVIELLNRISDDINHEDVKNAGYLVNAGVESNSELAESMKSAENQLVFLHDHVAGVFLFKCEGRTGIVLMDPASGVAEPVVVIHRYEDQSPPMKIKTRSRTSSAQEPTLAELLFESADRRFRLKAAQNQSMRQYKQKEQLAEDANVDSSNRKYISVMNDNYIFAEPIENADMPAVLYYTAGPFCSFLDSSTKPQLLNPLRTLKSWNKFGTLKAEVSMNIVFETFDGSHKTTTNRDTQETLRIENRERNVRLKATNGEIIFSIKRKSHLVLTLHKNVQWNNESESLIFDACRALHIDPKRMIQNMTWLTTILKDDQFLTECQIETDKLNLLRRESIRELTLDTVVPMENVGRQAPVKSTEAAKKSTVAAKKVSVVTNALKTFSFSAKKKKNDKTL